MENTVDSPQTSQEQDLNSDRQGFNFAELPIFAGTQTAAAPPVQPKPLFGAAPEKVKPQVASPAEPAQMQAEPVQRQEDEEDPAQMQAEPVQRQDDEEEPAQMQAEPVQRQDEEEEPAQMKAEPVQRQDEEEEPGQMKAEAVQRQDEEEDPAQMKAEAVQRQDEEEDPAQMKAEAVQRQDEEEDPAQMKGEADQQTKPIQPKINLAPSGSGKPMPEPVQQKMEGAFGADFSGVRIHEGPQAKAINAVAYTQGENIHFQPGKYQPDTQSGQELLGHELTHVVQQKAGRVTVPQRKAMPINAEANLETEADVLGAKAARGEQVQVAGASVIHQLMKKELDNAPITSIQAKLEMPSDFKKSGDIQSIALVRQYNSLGDKPENVKERLDQLQNLLKQEKINNNESFKKAIQQEKESIEKAGNPTKSEPPKEDWYIKPDGQFLFVELDGSLSSNWANFTQGKKQPVKLVSKITKEPGKEDLEGYLVEFDNQHILWVPNENLEKAGSESGKKEEPQPTPTQGGKLESVRKQYESKANPTQGSKPELVPQKDEPQRPPTQGGKSESVPQKDEQQPTTKQVGKSESGLKPAESKADPWKSAEKLDDPALKAKHQGDKWYIKADGNCAKVNKEDGSLEPPLTSFPGGPTPVKLVEEKTKSVQFQFLPAGIPLLKPDTFQSYNPIDDDWYVTKVIKESQKTDDVNKSVINGLVINVRTSKKLYGGEFWVSKDSLKTKSVNGYVVSSGTQKYWVPEANMEKSAAGFVQQDVPLFPEDPTPEHVLQGSVGDCYLMAALASITAANRDYPKDMMKDNGDGTVTVRLYNVTKSETFTSQKSGEYASQGFEAKKQYIRINKSVAQDNRTDLYAQKNLWVQMIEKAYAASGQGGSLLKKAEKGSYDNIEGGSSKFAFEVLLGKEATITNLAIKQKPDKGGDHILTPVVEALLLGKKPPKDAILTQISQALEEGKAVAAGTRQLTAAEQSEGQGHSAGESQRGGIVAGHGYTVLAVDIEKKEITVRNPWGKYGRAADGTTVKEGNGTFSLSLNEFLNWFSNLYISGKVEKLPDN